MCLIRSLAMDSSRGRGPSPLQLQSGHCDRNQDPSPGRGRRVFAMDGIAIDHPAARHWRALMTRLQAEMAARGVHPARAVVLLPYAQLMPLARRFWADAAPDGFAPRFETTMNWARQHAWMPGELDLSFEIGRALLTARAWLEQGGLRVQ